MKANPSAPTALLVEKLNKALAWEKRAEAMYSHYAAYVTGIYRLHLKPYFAGEAAESTLHAQQVRDAIVRLGGIAVTDRDSTPIPHTTDYAAMLQETLRTEQTAASTYQEILSLIDDENDELYDLLQQIYFAEERSLQEIQKLIG